MLKTSTILIIDVASELANYIKKCKRDIITYSVFWVKTYKGTFVMYKNKNKILNYDCF